MALKHLRHPLIGHIIVQVAFWFLVNISFSVYTYLFFSSIERLLSTPAHFSFLAMLTGALIMACVQGLILGTANYFINKLFIILKSLWRIVLLYILASMGTFSLSYFVFNHLIANTSLSDGVPFVDQFEAMNHVKDVILFHSFLGSIIAGLGVQVVKKYGRDIFVPMLLGFYRKPREEKRIFMFVDLKSSTSLAEQLGHLSYSAFVQDFILEVNQCLDDHHANIYQYVGDEVVLTWKCSKKNLLNCAAFFFACKNQIEKRRDYYMKKYGNIPLFKAGVDCGIVTAVEIGDIKRDIAYHGDTLNTAARIQGICNEVGCSFLISKSFVKELGDQDIFPIHSLGNFCLKGKEKPVEVFEVMMKESLSVDLNVKII